MKQIASVIFIIILSFSTNANAQDQKFYAGAKVGMGLSTFSGWDYRTSGSDSYSRSPLAGLSVALTGKYQLSDLLGIQAELQFAQKGEVMTKVASESNTFKRKTVVNYLTLPVMLNVSHAFNDILVYGNLGPYFSLGLSAQAVMKEPTKDSQKIKFQEGGLRMFDMGLCIGAGAGYGIGPGAVILDLRYDLGFINTQSIPDGAKGSNYKSACNRTLFISLGYVIPIGSN